MKHKEKLWLYDFHTFISMIPRVTMVELLPHTVAYTHGGAARLRILTPIQKQTNVETKQMKLHWKHKYTRSAKCAGLLALLIPESKDSFSSLISDWNICSLFTASSDVRSSEASQRICFSFRTSCSLIYLYLYPLESRGTTPHKAPE